MSDEAPAKVSEKEILAGRWPEDFDVAIAPGVGGGRRNGDAFAPTATDVYDALRDKGVRVAYAGPDPDRIVLLKSADWWGPVLIFGSEVAKSVPLIWSSLRSRISFAGRSDDTATT